VLSHAAGVLAADADAGVASNICFTGWAQKTAWFGVLLNRTKRVHKQTLLTMHTVSPEAADQTEEDMV
jgi:hypothetical protein